VVKEEPKIEYEDPSYLDGLWSEEDIQNAKGLISTISLKSGLLTQLLPSGDVLQTRTDRKDGIDEKYRIFTGTGSVVRHLANGDIEVLYANGNRAEFLREDKLWVVTNNKGRRRARKENVEWDLESIPCAYETDAVSYARVMFREDNVMTIRFKDNSFYAQFADGT